ncbi:SIS domain-containing protein [Halomonas desiderata]|jgi:D-sedoheptulose 7-phosphate isomerase|uniref:Phosphoheptose isomerase n=2 Tax=Billgrantia desiderata TaxID=52021 RepID=A0ABS9B8C2_9GAMM|nr:SIS domain-containing protein [Halomonas desiderata]MCE8010066.1 SIS domain-containing protein [Halomonas desiderata]MCE8043795.1 SIS domain-containing protein [Halomonas desiderata]MCE8048482.1 SIS domain-containing protein [Halomonas desiderata]NIC35958.1 SIS domain-containing protein [Halomonas desiderata]
MEQYVYQSLNEARAALDALLDDGETLRTLAAAGRQLSNTFRHGGRVFSCGNGGSMCDAMHFAEELSGRYRLHRKGLPAASISDPSHLSCVGNDYGYDRVFARYLEAHGREGDCLLAISTSGTSTNVLAAADYASRHGIHIIALTGRPGSTLSELSDTEICTPAGQYADRVQELHIKVIHILIELVERELFPENY